MRSRRVRWSSARSAPSPRWGWRPAGAGNAASSGGSGSGGGGGGAARRRTACLQPVRRRRAARSASANSGDWDSLDPGDTYYGYSWDFIRLLRPLAGDVQVRARARTARTLVPDLADVLGKPSDNGKTWTYTLRKGVKFEDGTPDHVQGRQVRASSARWTRTTFPNGPTYFNDFLDLQGYTAPYKDPTPDKLGLKAIETPDDKTIVFHLKPAVRRLRLLRPAAVHDPGARRPRTPAAKYKEHVVSTGPYMFDTNELGKSFTLDAQPQLGPGDRPRTARRCRTRYEVDAQRQRRRHRQPAAWPVTSTSTSRAPACSRPRRARSSPTRRSRRTPTTRDRRALWYTAINGDVAPLDNIDCRKAVEYAADKTGYQRAYGGAHRRRHRDEPAAAGDPGLPEVRPLRHAEANQGDVDKAKAGAAAVRPAQRLRDQHLLPRRAAEGEGDRRVAAAVAGQGRHQARRSSPTRRATTSSCTPASRTSPRRTTSASWSTAGARTGPTATASSPRSSTAASSATGGNTNLGVKDPRGRQAARQGAARRPTRPSARRSGPRSTRRSWSDAFVLPGVWAKGLLYRPQNLTNVFVNDGVPACTTTRDGRQAVAVHRPTRR